MTARRLPAALRRSLRTQFGIASLRDGQQQVIGAVLDGRDVLAVMPTGAGKSLCYQLPALHLKGTTVVVSPLIALMKDQADKLADAGIDAEQLNSAQPKRAQDESMLRLERADSTLVFVTPERLVDPAFQAVLLQQPVALLVIDEAHCISQWGHDFRPAYLEIGRVLEQLGRPTVLALTATAPDRVVDDIRQQLGRPALEVVSTGLYRPNLRLQVVRCTREEEKFERLLEALANAKGTGIVYTATVKNCTELHRRLAEAGESVSLYHGRLPARERREQQERFVDGGARVMVATGAFGMGIDMPEIRFVLHYQMPGSLAAYYQEAGRAGRDGHPADCLLLFWRNDRQVQQFFLARRRPTADALQRALALLDAADAPATAQALIGEHRPAFDRGELNAALAVLRDGGLALSDRARRWRRVAPAAAAPVSATALAALADRHVERGERDHEALERMVFYGQTGFCRWRVLLEAFDEPLPFEGEHCGICDNCVRPPAPPEPAATHAPPAPRRPAEAFAPGQTVRVPRHGAGQVEEAAGDEVRVVFPDGRRRSFVAAYVRAVA